MSITVIPSDESQGPKLGSVRNRLIEMSRAIGVKADTGGGLGPAELEMLARELRQLARRSAENDSDKGRMPIVEAVALAFSDLEEAEARIKESRAILARQIDGDDADPEGRVTRGITSVLSLCQRAQSTIGATRLVRS